MGAVQGITPPDVADRNILHHEIHARPTARIRIPSLVTHVAITNVGLTAADEHAHLQTYCAALDIPFHLSDPGFFRGDGERVTIKWERHGEFSRYSITQGIDQKAVWGADQPSLASLILAPAGWLAALPGQTLSAVQIVLFDDGGESDFQAGEMAQAFIGMPAICGSHAVGGNARCFTNFQLRADGFMRFVVLCKDLSEAAAGRLSAALLEMETYRIMALRGFIAARRLMPTLSKMESRLVDLTKAMHDPQRDDAGLLDELIQLSAEVELDVVRSSGTFAAAKAYQGIVQQRLADHFGAAGAGTPVAGLRSLTMTVERRQNPALATVDAASLRIGSISERVFRASALLRTRVEIQTEVQNQNLLRSLGEGQKLQLHLQQTVEGLSIAAITYYVVSLVERVAEAAVELGAPIHPVVVAGASIPVVVIVLWGILRRLRRHLQTKGGPAQK